MNAMRILMGKLKDGDKLVTPVRSKEFIVEHISETEVMLIIGEGWRNTISAKCLNGIPNFLKDKDWVEIRATHSNESKPGTLEAYLNYYKLERKGISNYVASILEYAEIVDIDRKLPSKVRLSKNKFA